MEGSDAEGASVLLGKCECVLRMRQKSGRGEEDWPRRTVALGQPAEPADLSLALEGARRAGRVVCADLGLPLPEALM